MRIPKLEFRGKPCILARDLGVLLGYVRYGRCFVNRVTNGFSKHLVRGVDYEIVQGEDLVNLKDLNEGQSRYSSKTTVIYWPGGVAKVCKRSRKPADAQVVLSILEEGFRSKPAQLLLPLENKENNLQAAPQPTEQPDKTNNEMLFRCAEGLKALGSLGETVALRVYLDILERNGVVIHAPPQAPPPPPQPKEEQSTNWGLWETPEAIGVSAGVDKTVVGNVISNLGLRGNVPEMSMEYVGTYWADGKKRKERTTMYIYSPTAVKKIREQLLRSKKPLSRVVVSSTNRKKTGEER